MLFKDYIEEERLKRCLSKEEFAKFLEVSYSTYYGYSNGTRYPNYSTARKIAKKLRVSYDSILNMIKE